MPEPRNKRIPRKKKKGVLFFCFSIFLISSFCLVSVSFAAKPSKPPKPPPPSNNPPSVLTISPSSGTALVDTPVDFTTTYTDADGWQDIAKAELLINTSPNSKNCFHASFDQNSNKFYLRADNGKRWLRGFAPGSANIIENSYVKLDCSKSSVSGSADTLTVNWNITFKSTFTGTKNLYLYVEDGAGASEGWINKGTCDIASTQQDTTPPTGSITINTDAQYTNSTSVTLSLSAQDNSGGSGLNQMQFSNDNITYSTPEAYSTTKSWTLTSGNGTKTVYVKYSDNADNWSNPYSDTIISDTTSPLKPQGLSANAGDSTVDLSWTANTEPDLAGYNIYRSTDGTNYNKVNPTLITLTSYQDTGLTNGTTYYYKISAQDNADNESAYSDVVNAIPNPAGLSETEPNDNFASANSINLDEDILATINPLGDWDHFQVHVDSSGTLTVEITSVPANINPYVVIFNSAQVMLKYGYTPTPGQDFTLSAEVDSSGDYYIRVLDTSNNASSESTYNLRAKFTINPDTYEPNDSFNDAKLINTNTFIQATILPVGDQDYYQVHTDTFGLLTVEITNVPANINPYVYIYDSSQVLLKSGYAAGSGQSVTISSELNAGDYYIRVVDANNDAGSASVYNLKAGFSDFYFTNFSDTPDPFSPNEDGQKDTATINATTTEIGNWIINIKDASDNIKRTYTGTGANISIDWDGKDESGIVVADATYTYTIDAINPSTGSIAPTVSDTVTVDNAQPIAIITSPNKNDLVRASFDISGTATDDNFSGYQVEYSQGVNPSTWNLIRTSSAPVTDGLLANWDSYQVGNGTYTIRLTVTDTAGNTVTAEVRVNVDNMTISNVFISPDVINITNSETAAISYTIDRNANVTIKLYDLNNNLKRTLIDSLLRTKGANSELWDGRDDAGIIVSDDAYTITIEAQSDNTINWYQSSGGFVFNAVPVQNFNYTAQFNPYNNEPCQIQYTLSENALFQLQAGKDENYATWLNVIDWVVRPKGSHTEYWDGRDRNGDMISYYTITHPIIIGCRTKSLPENSIVVTGATSVTTPDVLSDPYAFMPAFGEFTEISYSISLAGTISLSITKPDGTPVTILEDNVSKDAGTYTLTWDGTDSSGKVVDRDNDYIIKVEFTGADGKTIIGKGNISTR